MKTQKLPISWIKRNSPIVLACVSAIGVVVTAVLSANAAPKAKQLLDNAEKEKGEELTKIEKVAAVAPAYIPAIVSGTLTIACMFSINVMSRKSQAALSSAYALLDQSYRRYQTKVKEILGEDAHKKVMDAIIMEDADDVYISACGLCNSSLDFGVKDEVERRFYDSYSGRAFSSTISKVLQAEYHLNRNFCLGGGIDINQFYEFLGLSPIDGGDAIGWDFSGGLCWIDFNHSITRLDDGFEYCIIDFLFSPEPLSEYY